MDFAAQIRCQNNPSQYIREEISAMQTALESIQDPYEKKRLIRILRMKQKIIEKESSSNIALGDGWYRAK